MTELEIIEYINENEPDVVNKNEICGRWERREWNLDNSKIIETYTYKHDVTHRQCYAVESVVRKEVLNG